MRNIVIVTGFLRFNKCYHFTKFMRMLPVYIHTECTETRDLFYWSEITFFLSNIYIDNFRVKSDWQERRIVYKVIVSFKEKSNRFIDTFTDNEKKLSDEQCIYKPVRKKQFFFLNYMKYIPSKALVAKSSVTTWVTDDAIVPATRIQKLCKNVSPLSIRCKLFEYLKVNANL